MNKFYFICNKWLAIDNEDYSLSRIIPVSDSTQKNEFGYLFEKVNLINLGFK